MRVRRRRDAPTLLRRVYDIHYNPQISRFNEDSRDGIVRSVDWIITHMALFGLFGRKNQGYASPWLQLTVVYATARDGLEPDAAYAFRGKMLAAGALHFEFINPASFLAFYPGTAAGLQAGTQLADTLRAVARDKSVPAFGAAVQQGECLAQMGGPGRLAAKPAGAVISRAMNLASEEANGHAR